MNSNRNNAARRTMNYVRMFALLTLSLTLFAQSPRAQAQPTDSRPAGSNPAQTYQTLYLTSPAQESDAREIVTDLRNMLPQAKVYYVPSQNAISMLGTSGDFVLAKQILSDIDRARKFYRLTYTITETDSGQPVATRHVTLIVAAGETADLKQGTRMPIVTGSFDNGTSNANTQVQYLDVGLNIRQSEALLLLYQASAPEVLLKGWNHSGRFAYRSGQVAPGDLAALKLQKRH